MIRSGHRGFGPLAVAVMGTGNWGRNLVRVLEAAPGVRVAWVVDPDDGARAKGARLAPRSTPVSHIGMTGYRFDAAVVATPATEHVAHVTPLLERGKHVLVEKPAALDTARIKSLVSLANGHGIRFMVGHQLLFHPLFEQLKEAVAAGEIGAVTGIAATRTGPVDLSREPGVIGSYGPHDVAMTADLLGGFPERVTCTGKRNGAGLPVSATLSLGFPSGIGATIALRANDGTRVRRFEVHGERGALVFDDSLPGGRLVRIFPDGSARTVPSSATNGEPLALECAHFIDGIRRNRECRSGPAHMTGVTTVLQTASEQMRPVR